MEQGEMTYEVDNIDYIKVGGNNGVDDVEYITQSDGSIYIPDIGNLGHGERYFMDIESAHKRLNALWIEHNDTHQENLDTTSEEATGNYRASDISKRAEKILEIFPIGTMVESADGTNGGSIVFLGEGTVQPFSYLDDWNPENYRIKSQDFSKVGRDKLAPIDFLQTSKDK